MKDIIAVMDEDPFYSKKFCNQANRILGKKYNFLTFSSLKILKEYAEENKIESLITSDTFIDAADDVKTKSFYILNEKDNKVRREGKKSYIYKLQNINGILETIDSDLTKKNEKIGTRSNEACKLIIFYSTTYIKNKFEIIKRMAKLISKKKKALIVDLDEFDNYKGSVGLSNLIFDYKENAIDLDKIKKEVINEKEVDFIKSVTYPEDFNVISNIDLANIVNEIVKLNYDYVFVNADTSYVKCQYLLNDADELIIMKGKDMEKNNKFKMYLKNENQMDLKKVTEFNVDKVDRAYILAFCKQYFVN